MALGEGKTFMPLKPAVRFGSALLSDPSHSCFAYFSVCPSLSPDTATTFSPGTQVQTAGMQKFPPLSLKGAGAGWEKNPRTSAATV